MGSLDSLRGEFKQFLLSLLDNHLPGISDLLFDSFVIVWIAFFALIVHVILHIFVRRSLLRPVPY